MTKGTVNPSISEHRFSCPHCGAYAHQFWHAVYTHSLQGELPPRTDSSLLADVAKNSTISPDKRSGIIEYCTRLLNGEVFLGDPKDALYQPPVLENVAVSVCYSCERPSLWVHDHIVDPAAATAGIDPNDDLSVDIRADFKEAAQILNASPRGAAALLRLCIQKLCIQLGEPGANLNTDIASLVRKGLDPHVQQALDIVRVVGNNSVHPGQIDLRDDRDTATKLFGLVNAIAEDLITRPARVQKLYKSIVPEADQQKITKRDNK